MKTHPIWGALTWAIASAIFQLSWTHQVFAAGLLLPLSIVLSILTEKDDDDEW